MRPFVLSVLAEMGIPDWPLDKDGLPIAKWSDFVGEVRIVCHSMTGSMARHKILHKWKAALLEFDPVI
ncbi:MAG TPA: hypothetical protein VGE35_01775 [Candidatus Paceibacterota bacterium]